MCSCVREKKNEGSGAKQRSGFEGKIRKSQLYSQAQPKKYCIYCVLEIKARVQSSAVDSKER